MPSLLATVHNWLVLLVSNLYWSQSGFGTASSLPPGVVGAALAGLVLGIVALRRRTQAVSCISDPIRGELLNLHQLQGHAVKTAQRHEVSLDPRVARPLLPRLRASHRILDQAYREFTQAVRENEPISPAAEWLLDNYYVIEQQVRHVEENLPRRYYGELPKLVAGDQAGLPRVFDIGLELIAHTHGRLDEELITAFVQAYQPIDHLTIGELWALPLLLRLGLLDDLGRLATGMQTARQARQEANELADHLLASLDSSRAELTSMLEERIRRDEELNCTYVSQLFHRLRALDTGGQPVLNWLERWLAAQGTTAEELVAVEHKRQAGNQVAVSNDISSLRLVSTTDWRDFFERTSLVEQALRLDPVDVYGSTDFDTRDAYRKVIERLARRTGTPEYQVARRALALAEKGQEKDPTEQRCGHVGYYLIDKGLRQTEVELGYRPYVVELVRRALDTYAMPTYLGLVGAFTGLALTAMLAYAVSANASPLQLLALGAVALLPCSALGVGAANWLLSLIIPPRVLPKKDYSEGIPPDSRTVVVVPAMLFDEQGIERLLEDLEIRHLANRDPNLHFALITDFGDAPQAEMPEDSRLTEAASRGIRELNERYGEGSFYLFHRRRRWNQKQGYWMGWERKRGKLIAFNRLLLGLPEGDFAVQIGDLSTLSEIPYVITLDADTRLPAGTARELIGTISHPLNKARYDREKDRVTAGYSIIQPRIGATLTGAGRSLYARAYSGSAGVDPYTRAVSDVYQDLFAEGSYVGKGIYDVRAFEAVLGERFPENALLSHDLIEGSFARTALVTDIELLDDHPSTYLSDTIRRHRWARGDWQLLPWLMPRVPNGRGERVRNSLSALSRWKLLDNMRRSLAPIAMTLLLLLGWTVLPGSPVVWSAAAALLLTFPIFVQIANVLLAQRRGSRFTARVLGLWESIRLSVGQAFLSVAFLVHESVVMISAIVRTLGRLFVTRRHLLEWEPSFAVRRRLAGDLPENLVQLAPAVVTGVLTLTGLTRFFPAAVPAAIPYLVTWVASPLVAYWVGLPTPERRQKLSDGERQLLRRVARKTWGFLEAFVGPDDNWLPPDNYQEAPREAIANRTSPTNIGLLLMSTLAAHDLGYVTRSELFYRLEQTLSTMEGLDRYAGHFYNWYDTQTLQPLPPVYVSTVDSGNLAAYLLTVRQGLLDLMDRPLIGEEALQGLADTGNVLRDEMVRQGLRNADVLSSVERVTGSLRKVPVTMVDWSRLLATLQADTQTVVESLAKDDNREDNDDNLEDVRYWAERLAEQVDALVQELQSVAPWIPLVTGTSAPAAVQESVRSKSRQRLPATGGLLGRVPSRQELRALVMVAVQQLPKLSDSLRELAGDAEERTAVSSWLTDLRGALERSRVWATQMERRCESLLLRTGALFDGTEFDFLFDEHRGLFSIGYSVTREELDGSHYDLLASEARLTSFLAIAKGDVGEEHWFRLGRPLTSVAGTRALLSWSGTMFEYLMPPLTMRTYQHSLLSHTYRAVVRRQRQYGSQRRVPWGISESGYARVDRDLNYQYRAFGVPGLSLRRGAGLDLVVSPYSTLLALAVEPKAVVMNLRRLRDEGLEGRYGFYEAVDYTARRLSEGQNKLIVRSYMAHHQGMGLVALANHLQGDLMVRRFHSDPIVKANALLLQERVPGRAALRHLFWQKGVTSLRARRRPPPPAARRPVSIHTRTPRAHFLSNGTYTTMVTNSGGGYSAWNGRAVTRWRGDATRDHWGTFIYVRDLDRDEVWSAGFQPTTREPERYEATFLESQVLFRRRDDDIETQTEIAVSTEDNVEVRRITLTNHTRETRRLDLTSYAEIVLTAPGEDLAHPAFSNLHVETEFLPELDALLCRRRPRSAEEKPIWAVHVLGVEGWVSHTCEAETDRARFLGRGRTPADPAALAPNASLSNTVGAVLDPIVSLRQPVALEPRGSAQVSFSTGVAESRDEAIELAAKYHDPQAVARALAFSHSRSRLERRYMGLSAEQALLFQRLASRVLFSDPSLQADPVIKALNTKGQSALWRYGISGDLPIILLRIGESEDVDLVRQLLLAHEYWQARGLSIDLVILDQHPLGYSHNLRDKLADIIRGHQSQLRWDKPGGVFLLHSEQMDEEDQVLLSAVARAVVIGGRGSLAEQLDRKAPEPDLPVGKAFHLQPSAKPSIPAERPNLAFDNGLGGFLSDGSEYVIVLTEGQWTPAPWINVVANPDFGFLISEAGSGHTWSGNSRERRLTPWANDPISDPPGEVLYLRDEETGEYWSPTPLPIRESDPYVIRHGQGYTVFEHTSHGLEQELLMFVPLSEPVKVCRLRVRNLSDRQRRISATRYVAWVLGVTREQEWYHIVTEMDPTTGAVLARNTYGDEFAQRVAFADVNRSERQVTADRMEFIGRNGSLTRPVALSRAGLGSRIGAGLDPCAAIQVRLELNPGEEDEIVFLLGEAEDIDQVQSLIQRYRRPDQVRSALEEVRGFWDRLLSTVQVRTPDESLNVMLNRWLPYQTLTCRVWGRSALYQSGGAYGFRDQLQDVMALVYAAPEMTREQILRAAAHQFEEGDVQHWWHPPSGRGVRTRFSDDLLWLPFVTAHYLRVTGDADVLDEEVPFLSAPELEPGQESSYSLPEVSDQAGTVYEHCTRAVERALRFGRHGLPLMGAGDWNDGMNLVGMGGQGESVWLAWFLHSVLTQFADVCASRGDDPLAERCLNQAAELRQAIEEQAWDGEWYRRAYYDDGTPLGSIQSDEAQIDSIAQSWGVISGAADPARARQAMEAVRKRLVWEEEGLMPLFTPPFDKTEQDPGYIKGYLPGVRENGGQYTHAALWTVMAFAELGDGDRAAKLLHMLNPVNHARIKGEVERYRVEPYVVTADVYTAQGHVGRGGWSWYTGAAGWMYRVGLESILGFQPRGDSIAFNPCIPRDWHRFEVSYRHGDSIYKIIVENPEGVCRGVRSVELDGKDLPSKRVLLDGSGGKRHVRVKLGA